MTIAQPSTQTHGKPAVNRRDNALDAPRHAPVILDFWFSSLDDDSRLEREAEPFGSCYRRWYGKEPAIDAEILQRFEPLLLDVVRNGHRLDAIITAWSAVPQGLLALVILLDQLPRNMYRGSARMYAHDPLALAVTLTAIRAHEHDARLPLVRRMFLYVPLMHVEDVTLQEHMLTRFDDLAAQASSRSPHNRGFFGRVQDSARRHLAVVERFGRFPHRNAILGRHSTPAEEAFLVDHPGF